MQMFCKPSLHNYMNCALSLGREKEGLVASQWYSILNHALHIQRVHMLPSAQRFPPFPLLESQRGLQFMLYNLQDKNRDEW